MGPCLRRGTPSIRNGDDLDSAVPAANDRQRGSGQAERLGQEFQDGCIGFSILWSSGNADQQDSAGSVVVRHADAVLSRVGSDPDGQRPIVAECQYLLARGEKGFPGHLLT